MKIFIYVTLSLNPFPRERDLPSLRSKFFYRVYFNSMSAKMAEVSLKSGYIYIWSISVPSA